MTGPLNQIEIGVTVNDDTAAGFASIMAKAAAFRAALAGSGGTSGPGADLGIGALAARAAGLSGAGTPADTAKAMRAALQQLRQGGAAHQDLLLTVRQLNSELAKTPASEGGTGATGAAAAASIAAAVAAAMQSSAPASGSGNSNAVAQAAAAAAGAWISRRLGGAGGSASQPYSSAVAAAAAAAAAQAAGPGTSGGGGGGGGGGGWAGFFTGLFGRRLTAGVGGFFTGGPPLNVFGKGGALSFPGGGMLPAWLATITGAHLATEAVIEFAGVWLPAAAAVAAFAAAAVPAVQNVVRQAQNLNSVATALNVNIPGLSGAFNRVAQAVQPRVYQLAGDALLIAAHGGNEFSQMAKGAASVTDVLAARFTAAITQGHGFSQFVKDSVPDYRLLGDSIGNIAGAIGSVLQVLPGYAQMLLKVGDATTHAFEIAVQFLQPVIGIGLAAHGAIFYIGLLAVAINFLATRGLTLVASAAEAAGGKLVTMGAAGRAAAMGLGAVADGATAAAELPWGWIAVVAAGLALLAYHAISAKNAAQQFNATIQQGLQNAPITALQTSIMTAQVKTAQDLATAQRQVMQAQVGSAASMTPLQRAIAAVNSGYVAAMGNELAYVAGGKQLEQQSALVSGRLAQVANAVHTTGSVFGLLNAAGVTSSQILDTNKAHWAATMIQVLATAKAYQEMGQQSGIFGADMNVLNALVSDQYTAMQNLNQQWSTYLGNIITGEQNTQNAVTGFRTLNSAIAGAGGSFTGIDANSITLQGDFSTLFTSVQNVVGSLRSANAPARVLAGTIATYLAPAVHDGALENAGFRTAIYDMAQEAGYKGVDSVRALTTWINNNTTSLQKVTGWSYNWLGVLAKLAQEKINEVIHVSGLGTYSVSGTGIPGLGVGTSGQKVAGRALGGPVYGSAGQPQLIMAHAGEAVVPQRLVGAVAPILSAGGVPGFAAGGIVGSYAGSLPGMSPWVLGETAATVKAMENAVAAATFMGIKSAQTAILQGSGGIAGIGGGVGRWANDILTVLHWLGQPSGDLGVVLRQMTTESGGNPTIVNRWDSNWLAGHPSVGLMQVIAGTFGAFAGPFLGTGPFEYGVSVNPLANIYAGLNYAIHRYGSNWTSVLGQGHGYDSGGWLPPGLSLAWNGTGQPERVSPGGHTVIVLELASTGSDFDRFMTNWLQNAVTVKGGGDVQIAFGRRN